MTKAMRTIEVFSQTNTPGIFLYNQINCLVAQSVRCRNSGFQYSAEKWSCGKSGFGNPFFYSQDGTHMFIFQIGDTQLLSLAHLVSLRLTDGYNHPLGEKGKIFNIQADQFTSAKCPHKPHEKNRLIPDFS